MAEFLSSKWGSQELGTPGGVVTWSIVGHNQAISRAFRLSDDVQTVSPDGLFPFSVTELIQASFNTWSASGNIEFLQINDPQGAVGAEGLADIRIGFALIDGPGNVSGRATEPSKSGDIIIEADGDERLQDPAVFQNILTHEIGHTLGLDHETDVPAILNPVNSSRIELEDDDIEGIQTIYGVQDDARPTLRLDEQGERLRILEPLEDLRVVGSLARDNVRGSTGDELFLGRTGNDLLHGGGGEDVVKGGAGNDVIKGGGGADRLFGNAGNDRLVGGLGDDTITGHGGDDILVGRGGADQFNFTTSFGDDRIIGFQAGLDTLNFQRSADVAGIDDLSISQSDGDVVVTDRDGDTLLLVDADLADITSDDFLF